MFQFSLTFFFGIYWVGNKFPARTLFRIKEEKYVKMLGWKQNPRISFYFFVTLLIKVVQELYFQPLAKKKIINRKFKELFYLKF